MGTNTGLIPFASLGTIEKSLCALKKNSKVSDQKQVLSGFIITLKKFARLQNVHMFSSKNYASQSLILKVPKYVPSAAGSSSHALDTLTKIPSALVNWTPLPCSTQYMLNSAMSHCSVPPLFARTMGLITDCVCFSWQMY